MLCVIKTISVVTFSKLMLWECTKVVNMRDEEETV